MSINLSWTWCFPSLNSSLPLCLRALELSTHFCVLKTNRDAAAEAIVIRFCVFASSRQLIMAVLISSGGLICALLPHWRLEITSATSVRALKSGERFSQGNDQKSATL